MPLRRRIRVLLRWQELKTKKGQLWLMELFASKDLGKCEKLPQGQGLSLSLSLHHSLTALLIWIPNTEREGLSLKFPFHLKFASTKKEHSGTQSSYREKEWFSYITEDTESRLPHPVPKGTLSLAIHCSPGSPSPLKTITLIPEVPQASLLFSLWRGCAHLSYLAFPLVLHVVLFWCTYAHVHEFMCVSPSICLPSLRIYLG